MHGEELKYMMEAYETNWMSTVAAGIVEGLRDQYAIFDEPPVVGKDVNDQLQMRVGLKCKEEYSR